MAHQQQQQQQQQQPGRGAPADLPHAAAAANTNNNSSGAKKTTTATSTTAAAAVTGGVAAAMFCGADGAECTVPVVASFDDMPLHDSLLRGIYSHGFEKPSPIQQRAVVPMLRGGDVVAQAQSGTGKTGAFGIGVLGRCDFTPAARRETQALILAPTRELAQQTLEAVRGMGWYLARGAADAAGGRRHRQGHHGDGDGDDGGDSFCEMFVGGKPTVADVKRLARGGVVVAVGTPGRVTELIRRGALRVGRLKTVVLDEADEMLSQGFAEQVATIFGFLPRDVQIGLFSATMPPEVMALSKQFMREPTQILMEAPKLTLEGLKQFYVAVDGDAEKASVLADLYESLSVSQSVVFANTRRKVEWLAAELTRAGHTVAVLHAEVERGARERVMEAFRCGAARVLVTSDIVARGIDVQHVNMVVNVDMPRSVENYLHRIGRSARYGRKGIAINLIGSEHDAVCLREVEARYRMTVAELPMDFMNYFAASTLDM